VAQQITAAGDAASALQGHVEAKEEGEQAASFTVQA